MFKTGEHFDQRSKPSHISQMSHIGFQRRNIQRMLPMISRHAALNTLCFNRITNDRSCAMGFNFRDVI